LPVERIVRRIGVDQRVPEPFLTASPIDEQVLDEEGSDDQACAIGQMTRAPQLPHAGVGPGVKSTLVVAPRKALELRPQTTRRHIGMGVQQSRCKITPRELTSRPRLLSVLP